MKKIIISIICLFSILLLTGCESSEKDKLQLFNDLKKEKVIPSSMELIDIMSYSSWSLEWCTHTNYYIYKDNSSKMIAIQYDKDTKSEGNNHIVTIYNDVTIDNNVQTVDSKNVECSGSQSYYKYKNGEFTKTGRYKLGTYQKYHAYEKSSLFGKHYQFELTK